MLDYLSLSLIRDQRWIDFVCLLAGITLPLAFAPLEWFPIAFFAVAVFFYSCLHCSPMRAAWRAWLFSFGLLGVGAFWLHISIHQFGGVGQPLAVTITILFLALMALYASLLFYLVQRFSQSSPILRLLLIYPAAWVMAEWLRGGLFGGFPWLLLGYSQTGHTLSNLAPYLGVYGVSWATAFTAAGIAALLYQYRVLAQPSGNSHPQKPASLSGNGMARSWKRTTMLAVLRFFGNTNVRLVVLVSGLLLSLWLTAVALGCVSWTLPYGSPLRVALLQGNIPQQQKWLLAQRTPTLQGYVTMSRQVWPETDLVVWPENAVPAFFHEVRESFLVWLEKEAKQHKTELLIGIPVQDTVTQRYYNSLMHLGAEQVDFYYKRHLVPFGEYLPLRRWLSVVLDFLQIPMSNFAPGNGSSQIVMNGYIVGASICYEDAFGEEIIEALPQAHLLVNVSNDTWFGDSLAPHQHLQIARLRAKETERSLLRATNTGISALIGPDGLLLARSPQFSKHILQGTVQPLQGDTPYVRYGNLPVLLGLVLALLSTLQLFHRKYNLGFARMR